MEVWRTHNQYIVKAGLGQMATGGQIVKFIVWTDEPVSGQYVTGLFDLKDKNDVARARVCVCRAVRLSH